MSTNEYVMSDAPTEDELAVYRKVKRHLVERQVADFIDMSAPIPLTQEEFDNVVFLAAFDNGKPAECASISAFYLSELRRRK